MIAGCGTDVQTQGGFDWPTQPERLFFPPTRTDEPMPSGEYILIGVLLLLALLAFPAFQEVQAIQNFVLAICGGLGLN